MEFYLQLIIILKKNLNKNSTNKNYNFKLLMVKFSNTTLYLQEYLGGGGFSKIFLDAPPSTL